jgi:hypothetical protein
MSRAFLGVQLGSHSIFDEGIDHCLDVLQETAGINAVFVYATTYQGFAKGRNPGALASDHGVPVKDPRQRDLTQVWFTPHEQYYGGTFLRHDAARAQGEFHDRDVFAELREPLDKRDMKLYGRILEGFAPELAALIPNWTKIVALDCYGRPTTLPCWNNPDYVQWWVSTMEDLFRSYDLDGFKYGSERSGPLPNLLMGAYHGVTAPICFCEHCLARGRERGIDVERARTGFRMLYEYIRGLMAGEIAPIDGVAITFLRLLLNYPEILAWEKFWWDSREAVTHKIYGAIKAIKPEAQVGWHLYHAGTSWDPIYRAEIDYAEMAEYSDWIKPVVYHDIAGPRIRRQFHDLPRKRVLQELPDELALEALYRVMGYDPAKEPKLEELATRGLSPDYVYRQTKACVDAVGGRIPVYPGVGFDIPWKSDHFPSDPELVYQATVKAFEAGASGLVVSREYDEMRLENLRAVGRGVADAWGGGS